MKKTKKILLSALAIFSLFLTTNIVNAEEVDSTTEATTKSEVTETEATEIDSTQAEATQPESTQAEATQAEATEPENTTTKSISDLTDEEVKSIIPKEFEVSITKTEYGEFIINSEGAEEVVIDPLAAELEQKLIALFNQNGYTLENVEGQNTQYSIGTEKYLGEGNIDKAYITIFSDSLTDSMYESYITVKFAKESNYSTTDENYVKNKVNEIKFSKFGDVESEYFVDSIVQVYNIGDEESASKWSYENYDFNALVNDSSVTVKTSYGVGGAGGGTPWGHGVVLYFYKNNILYASKYIAFIGMYGTTLENGTPVNMARLEQTDEIYKEMAKELENQGLTNILGCYELTAFGSTYENMQVTFNLGTDYNGKTVKILHKKNDGKYEIFDTTVTDGKATITVNEFSPFMIALSDSANNTDNVNNAPNNAQTSSMNIVLYSILAIGSLIGITYILVSKKKEIA